MDNQQLKKTAGNVQRAASGEREGFWLAPATVVMVVLINVAILGYAIAYVARGTSSSGKVHAQNVAASQPAVGGAAGGDATPSAVLVQNELDLPPQEQIRKMYVQHCAACHGLGEKGDGPAAVWLFPQPRNFVDSSFRFAATGGSRTEVIAGLENTISKGIPRSAMPGFQGVLGEEYIAGLAHYVLDLQQAKSGGGIKIEPLHLGERPPTTSGLVQRGATLYKNLGCVTCHGQDGSGEGLASKGMVDSLGRPIVAADFRQGLYKSGGEPVQLARTIVHGVPGTPMNGYQGVLVKTHKDGGRDATDVWALVAYIQSFAGKGQQEGVSSGGLVKLHEFNDVKLLENPAHPAWLGIEPVTIRLQPLWRRDHAPTVLEVRAVHVDGQIAMCLDWNDSTMDLVKAQGKFSDAVAMMLSLGDEVPALPMGVSIPGFKAQAPVNIWHWQSHLQAAADASDVPSDSKQNHGDSLHIFKRAPHPATDAPAQNKDHVLPEYRTAAQAQNVLTEMKGYPALESNAIGFGTLKLQPAESQKLYAAALWTNGHWRVVLSRPWSPHDENDVQLEGRTRIPVAFAVWDGSNGDRAGKKLVSGWHWLVVNETSQTQPASLPTQTPQTPQSNPQTP